MTQRASCILNRPLMASLLAWPWLALAQTSPDRVLVDDGLERHIVGEIRFEPGAVSFERDGARTRLPLDGSVVAVVEPSGQSPRPRNSWIELTDGQRLVGAPLVLGSAEAAALTEATAEPGLVWATPLLGSVRVPLEALRRVVLREGGQQAEVDELNDVLVLNNGDQTRGLLERLWPEIVLETDGQMRTFELNAVSSISLANTTDVKTGSRVWLSDGSIVAVDSIITGDDGVQILPAAPVELSSRERAVVTMDEVLAVAFESGGVRPLAELGPPRWEALSAWALPPVAQDPEHVLLGAARIELIGPVAAAWSLPEGTRRVSIRARLRDDCRTWGDCVVSLSIGGQILASERLLGESPDATFTLDLTTELASEAAADELMILVEEGHNGAIQDRVMVEGFVLLSSDANQ